MHSFQIFNRIQISLKQLSGQETIKFLEEKRGKYLCVLGSKAKISQTLHEKH